MRTDHPYPVLELEQIKGLSSRGTGGRAAIEDLALDAYQAALDSGLSKETATKKYFEVFKCLKK